MSESVVAEARRLAEALAADPDRIEAEISGMSDEQMAYSADDPVWARWSAEMNLRHIALLSCRWLNRLRGPLEERGYTFPEVEMEAVMSGNSRHIPPAICPDTASLLAFIRAHCDLASGILSREGDETLRGISGERVVDPEASYTDSAERFIDFARIAAQLHPCGWTEVPGHPGRFRVEMIAALRQIHWEILAHLRTVQRIKGLLDLPQATPLPREGYLSIDRFYD
jgi:hypothetical protein